MNTGATIHINLETCGKGKLMLFRLAAGQYTYRFVSKLFHFARKEGMSAQLGSDIVWCIRVKIRSRIEAGISFAFPSVNRGSHCKLEKHIL